MLIQGGADKLETLAAAARFDVCGCGGAAYRASSLHFIHRAALPDGGCISLFKTLLTNACANDCAYCVNAGQRQVARATFQAEELARLFMDYQRRGLVEGLFLSSGVRGSPNHTMERMMAVVELLRRRYRFPGYIHLKLLPGATPDVIAAACALATRVSVNIEAPSAGHLARLSARKDLAEGILAPMRQVKSLRERAPALVPAGQTTQFVVGAAGEADRDILGMAHSLYGEMGLRRVYFSAYRSVGDPRLEGVAQASPWREHRLYQADWLLRIYHFPPAEVALALDRQGNLPLQTNPKLLIARRQGWRYPVDVNRGSYEELLHVPGIGPASARRILEARRTHALTGLVQLGKLGVRYREAAPFIWCRGLVGWERQLALPLPAGADEPEKLPVLALR